MNDYSYNDRNSKEIIDKIVLGENIAPSLYADVALEAARLCFDKAKKKNNSSQIRRFYDELVMWEDKINTAPHDHRDRIFEESVPYIWMLCAKLAYAYGRDLITEDFKRIFDHLIRQIKDPLTLKQAKTFFEAYLGFAKALGN